MPAWCSARILLRSSWCVARTASRRSTIAGSIARTARSAQGCGAVLDKLGASRAATCAVVDADDYQVVQVEAPDVLPSEMRAAVRWRLRDAISFKVDDAAVDVFEIPESARRTQTRMLFAVAARAAAIERVTSTLQPAAKGFYAIDIPELCLRNISALLPQDDKGVAMLALNENYAQLVTTRQGSDVPHPSHRHRAPLRAARAVARRGRLDAGALALELQRSLDYYESHYDQTPIGDLVIAPGGERAQRVAAALRNETSLRVSVLDVREFCNVYKSGELVTDWPSLMALGAALRTQVRGVERMRQQINLLSADFPPRAQDALGGHGRSDARRRRGRADWILAVHGARRRAVGRQKSPQLTEQQQNQQAQLAKVGEALSRQARRSDVEARVKALTDDVERTYAGAAGAAVRRGRSDERLRVAHGSARAPTRERPVDRRPGDVGHAQHDEHQRRQRRRGHRAGLPAQPVERSRPERHALRRLRHRAARKGHAACASAPAASRCPSSRRRPPERRHEDSRPSRPDARTLRRTVDCANARSSRARA